MIVLRSYHQLCSRLQDHCGTSVASHHSDVKPESRFHIGTCTGISMFSRVLLLLVLVGLNKTATATNYMVATKTDLQNRMNAALPGDTVTVANGTYNWGQIIFTNNNGTSSSSWIVLKAQSFRGVKFTGSTYLQFKGTRVIIDGFLFADGNAGTNAVISFRASSSSLASYCRVTNITIDDYNTYSADSSVENEWIGIYGTNNRVDHCTFIDKYNARATVVVWYANTVYPAPAPSTFHRIDSNYFNGRSYMGDNGGETIRVGTSTSSRTDGYNTIEYNLFENCTQTEPEIISNKSDFNTYRYNTFKNCRGGLTLRHGRYCNVYGNFFIVDDPAVIEAYAIRVIDKGHKIYNNYLEGVNGNASGGSSQLRAPINLYNGASEDTTDAAAAAGYFAADSCIVAFNTIVNAKGGGGIVLGGTGGGTIQPKGIVLANNVVKMTSGSALYMNSANISLTFSCEGNMYSAPSGIGVSTTGWTSNVLNFGARTDGTLSPPNNVQDAAANSPAYAAWLSSIDAKSRNRDAVFDAGAEELSSAGNAITYPLDSNKVGAGKPSTVVLPVRLVKFNAVPVNDKVQLSWQVENENGFLRYDIESGGDGRNFEKTGAVSAANQVNYSFIQDAVSPGKNYYRLKLVDKDGMFSYSPVRMVSIGNNKVNVYPNPANSIVVVELNGTVKPNTVIILFDASGKAVRNIPVDNRDIVEIPVRQLLPGLYHLAIVIRENILYNYPLIINK
jgi:poly(beta-D-mannuronate) lyase